MPVTRALSLPFQMPENELQLKEIFTGLRLRESLPTQSAMEIISVTRECLGKNPKIHIIEQINLPVSQALLFLQKGVSFGNKRTTKESNLQDRLLRSAYRS